MKISELFARQGSVEVEGTIKEIEEPRVFNKFGKELKVANAVLEDDSGTVKLTLWNDDIGKFKQGDKIRITNGYVNEYQGEKQLTTGKFGKMEKIGSGKNIQGAEGEEGMEVEEEKIEEEKIGGGDLGEIGGEEDF